MVLFILAACVPIPEELGQATTATQEATATAEPTATPLPAPTRPDEATAKQLYSPEQIQSITGGAFAEQEESLAAWWAYWQRAIVRPFPAETQPVFCYYWDENSKAGGVLIQPGGEYQSRSFYFPVTKDGYMTVPPEAKDGHTIPEGFGPLEVSGGNYVLAWRVNSLGEEGWVRLNKNGEIAEVINTETGQWQPERFYILTPELKKGCEYNLIRPDHIEEDMGKLLEKETALGLTAEDAFVMYNNSNFAQKPGGPIFNDYESNGYSPDYIPVYRNSEEVWKNRKISCSYMPTPEGQGIYIFGIPIRRIDAAAYTKSDIWAWLHFGVDPVVQNLHSWPDEENYLEEWEYYNITQNPDSDGFSIGVPTLSKAILKDGTIYSDDYSRTDWDKRYLNIIDLIKKATLESSKDLGPYKEIYQDPQSWLTEYIKYDHRTKGNRDQVDILSNLEKAQRFIIPILGIGFGK